MSQRGTPWWKKSFMSSGENNSEKLVVSFYPEDRVLKVANRWQTPEGTMVYLQKQPNITLQAVQENPLILDIVEAWDNECRKVVPKKSSEES